MLIKVVADQQYMDSSDGQESPSQITFFGRLHSKSLKQFKCICKFWSTLRDKDKKSSFIKEPQASFVEVFANSPIQGSTYNCSFVKADYQDTESSDGPELPSQIMFFEILPRLPYKSLIRFKCVCKSWSSLIRNPAFVNAHQKLGCNKHTHLLFTNKDKATKQQHFFSTHIDQQGSLTPATHVLSLPTPRIREDFLLYTAQAINGLACIYLSNNNSISHQVDPDNPVRIFNPCTREYITLPLALEAFPECHIAHHFGFSPVKNEYKVLQVQMDLSGFRGREHTQFLFKIFKLGTSLWRHVKEDLNDLSFLLDWPFHKRSVYINGAIHWINWSQNVIVVFDIGDEKFRVIPLAKDFTGYMKTYVDYPFGDLIEQGGCLALICDRILMEQNALELWILKDYENHVWVKETIIFPILWQKLEYPFPFCTTHSGELLFASKINIRKEPTLLRMHLYSMQGSKIYRESETCLPAEWTFPSSSQLKLLSSYQESFLPLR